MHQIRAFNLLFGLGLLFGAGQAKPMISTCGAPSKQIFQYADTTFIENLLVTPDGNLLLTTFGSGDLLLLDPRAIKPTPQKIVSLPGSTGLTGIAPLGDDLYAVTGGIHTIFSFEPGSLSVYVVSLTERSVIARIPVPNTSMLNGMAALPNQPSVILSADSLAGSIYRVDTRSKQVDVVITDPALGPSPTSELPLGVNGLKIWGNYLYFTNSGQGTFGRVPLEADGSRAGPFETVAALNEPVNMTYAYDDFAFDRAGNAYVALHDAWVNKITSWGAQWTFAGCGVCSLIKEPTAVALANDGKSIYVSTGGTAECGRATGGQIINIMI